MEYGYNKKVSKSFVEAVEVTKEALAKDGFGILTEIDVKATMKKKLGVDYDNYVILGACNPSFAHEALQTEKEIGLLLPCNVIVYEDTGSVYVSVIVPSVAMSIVENEDLASIASEVEDKLKKVIDSLN
ncbi:MAG: DUF302 domain-containing protein [Candidatus Paceibacterota bacterium]